MDDPTERAYSKNPMSGDQKIKDGERAILVPDCRDSIAGLHQRLGCHLDRALRIASMFPSSAGASRGLGGVCRSDE